MGSFGDRIKVRLEIDRDGFKDALAAIRYELPGWRVNPAPVLCHPGCIHCTPPSKAAA